MRFRTSNLGWIIVAVLPVCIVGLPVKAEQPPEVARHTVHLNGQTFTLPVGFTVEKVAGPPLADRPIVADFDELGRLYVADSSGSNEPVNIQLQKNHTASSALKILTKTGALTNARCSPTA